MLDEKLLLELQAFVEKHHQSHTLLHEELLSSEHSLTYESEATKKRKAPPDQHQLEIEKLIKTNRKPPSSKALFCVYIPELAQEKEEVSPGQPQLEIKKFIETNRKPTFPQVLFGLIDQKEVSEVEIYKQAGIDRRLFSKIRSNSNYRPNKNTAVAFALALNLSQDDADSLLRAAGYSLSENETFDLVIRFCLEKKIYNIDSVNQALDYFSLKPLGVLT